MKCRSFIVCITLVCLRIKLIAGCEIQILSFTNFITGYVTGWITYAIIIFLSGMLLNGVTNCCIITIQEHLPKNQKHLPGIFFSGMFSIGIFFAAGFLKLFPIWTNYSKIVGVFSFLLMGFVQYGTVESTRWLVINSPEKADENRKFLDKFRTEEAKKELDNELKEIKMRPLNAHSNSVSFLAELAELSATQCQLSAKKFFAKRKKSILRKRVFRCF